MTVERSDWHVRFKAMKKGMGFTNKHLSEITGNSYDSIKHTTQPKLELPRWAKLSVVIYETLTKKQSDEANTEDK